jgi:hypothetical protein
MRTVDTNITYKEFRQLAINKYNKKLGKKVIFNIKSSNKLLSKHDNLNDLNIISYEKNVISDAVYFIVTLNS